MPMTRLACAIRRSMPAMSGRRSSSSGRDGLRNRERRHSKVVDRPCSKTGWRHVDEDGDRLFRHLALALDLGKLRFGGEQERFDSGDVECRRDPPANWVLTR